MEKKNNETVNNVEQANNETNDIVVEEKSNVVKKIVKYVCIGLGFVVTTIAGVLVGKHMGNDDDDSSEDAAA